MAKTELTREQKQRRQARTAYLSRSTAKRLKQYADKHGMSKSEVIAAAERAVVLGELPPPQRERLSQKITFWVQQDNIEVHAKFVAEADRRGVPFAQALEQALEQIL